MKLQFGVELERYVKHYFPSSYALLRAIEMGCGYGVVPSDQAHQLLESGRLVDLAPLSPLRVPLYWHHWRREPPLAQRVTEFVTLSARQAFAFDGADDLVGLESSAT